MPKGTKINRAKVAGMSVSLERRRCRTRDRRGTNQRPLYRKSWPSGREVGAVAIVVERVGTTA